jgi:hypothetical protein
MAKMRLEINTAGGDLKNLASATFRNCVIAISSTQATLNVGRVRIAASVGSLRKPQRHQQGRYSYQQKYSFHGILLRFSPCGSLRFHLGFDLAVGPYAEHSRVVLRLSSGLGTWSIQSGTAQTLSGMDLTVCSQPLTFGGTALTKKGADRASEATRDARREFGGIIPSGTSFPWQARVRLVQQRSESPCQEGYSWGSDGRGIWVDHGCRADFAIEGGQGGWDRDHDRDRHHNGYRGDNQGSDQGQVVSCSSDDMHRHLNPLDDAHDGPLQLADAWLQQNIAPLISSPTFRTDGLLIIVFDEADTNDSTNGGGHVAEFVISPKAKKGYQSIRLYQHQSTLRLILDGLGTSTFPGAASTAPEMAEFF